MPGSLSHLAARFFDVLFSRPLSAEEREAVASWLSPELADVFFAQQGADQRHGHDAAASVVASGHEDRNTVATALLHDVGKRHARLGVIGRSVASVAILARLPLTDRMASYRDHGLIGAKELAVLGAPPLAIEFALHHHGERPDTIEPGTWEALLAADRPSKARR